MSTPSSPQRCATATDETVGRYPYQRPKDAATLLILDRSGKGSLPKVLMGRRNSAHVFMPGAYVFPGGRLDPGDSRIRPATDYHPDVAAKLALHLKGPRTAARVRALGLAAIRETQEEVGLLLGTKQSGVSLKRLGKGFESFSDFEIAPSLAPLRFIARAITPPARSRRFDTRFLAVDAREIAHRLPLKPGPDQELEDVAWLPLDTAISMDTLPGITRQILKDLCLRLEHDPDLNPATPIPFYFFRSGLFQREML